MNIVNVQINLDSPTGRRLLREAEKHPKSVKVEYPIPEAISGQRTYTLEESFNECCNILSDHYGVDVQKL